MTAPILASSLFALVTAWAAQTPAREALTDEHGTLSYAELAAAVEGWSRAMAVAGVVPGDRVAMLARPGRESLICLVATAELGAIWSGIDPRLRTDEVAQRIGDLRPRLVFISATLTNRELREDVATVVSKSADVERLIVLDEQRWPGAELDAFLRQGNGAPGAKPPHSPDQPAIIVYTSGSSGEPKGAMLSEAAMLDMGRRQNALWPVAPMRTLNFLPIGHAGAIVDLTVPTLIAGGCVVFQRKFDAEVSLEIIARERISFWASVPSTFILQAALPGFADADLSSVQLIAMEGASIPEDLAATFVAIAPVATNYGMTETCTAISAMSPTRSIEALVGSVGHPFGDAAIRIDGAGDGEVGEILVRSPRNLLGYWNKPDATRAAFTKDGFFRTGDLGVLLPDGRLRLAGRKREMFKSGGYNVYPGEVERAIAAHGAVADVAVVPTPHPVWSEVGTAFVVAADASGDLVAELERLCNERLANYKRPKRFVLIDAMPLLPIGKVDRQALKQRAAART